MTKRKLTKQLEVVRNAARRAISPIKPADASTQTPTPTFLFEAQRSDAGRSLPPYYLVYFLLVELLEFKNLGQFEKVAWSIPIDLDGVAYLIEHRKFGVGVFVQNKENDEPQARRIVSLINNGVKVAKLRSPWLFPTFAWPEHNFIHLAILQGNIQTGEELGKLVSEAWNVKFKSAFDLERYPNGLNRLGDSRIG